MTINSNTTKTSYVGDGVTTAFAVPFAFFGADELEVIERTIASGAEAPKALTTDYTVTGGNGATGTVTAVSAPPIGVQWHIRRRTKRTQLVDYTPNDPFPAETHERALDRLTAIAQEQEEVSSRGLSLAKTSGFAGTLTFPDPGASKFLRWNAGGTALETADIAQQGAIALPLTIAQGGTGAVTAAAARTVLGLGTAATQDYGTAANQLVRLDASAKLPAVDGSQLTNVGGMPRSYLAGLTLANNGSDATNDIDIAAGAARDDGNAADLVLASALTKQLDAAWTAGTNQGMRDTGSIANGTWHIFLIKRPDTGVVDILASLSATAPTMPANYTLKRRIGSILREGGSIVAFAQLGDEFLRKASVLDVSANNPGTSAVTRTLSVPTGIKVWAMIRAQITATGGTDRLYLAISSFDENDQLGSLTTAPLNDGHYYTGTDSSQPALVGTIRTNTSGQIRSRISTSSTNETLYIATRGWIDRRGRDD